MESLIQAFPDHLSEALSTARTTTLKAGTQRYDHVLITGLGGSGIGGTIVSEWVAPHAQVPVIVNKDYSIPAYIGKQSLVIACSYSGNTEETLTALEQAQKQGATIACITSGGQLGNLAKEQGWNMLEVPGGNPPRSMLGYSLVHLLFLLRNYGIVLFDFEAQLEAAIAALREKQENIQTASQEFASKLKGRIPVVYAADGFGGVAVRWMQQLNENSKVVGWYGIVPEMNHNELVGWAGGSDQLAVVFLRNTSDLARNQRRIEINQEIVQRATPHVFEVWSQGNSRIEEALYLIHWGDWLSLYLSELNGVDVVEVKVIDFLKGELAKL